MRFPNNALTALLAPVLFNSCWGGDGVVNVAVDAFAFAPQTAGGVSPRRTRTATTSWSGERMSALVSDDAFSRASASRIRAAIERGGVAGVAAKAARRTCRLRAAHDGSESSVDDETNDVEAKGEDSLFGEEESDVIGKALFDLDGADADVVHPDPDDVSGSGSVNGEEGDVDEGSDASTASGEAAGEVPIPIPIPIPPAGHSITSEPNGPSGAAVHTLTVHLGAAGHPQPLVFTTGDVGRQASGAVTLSRGDTVIYATACRDKDPKEIDFLPLSVDYQERFSSAGMTSGSYNRRDGRPAEHEILTCRLIDRPLRPLIMEGWRHETQLLSWVLSYDGERDCDPLAITASAASLWLSDVPLLKPVAAVVVGLIDDVLVLNPTNEQMDRSKLHLTVAGTKEGVLMIEGAADYVTEETMVEAVSFGHRYVAQIADALEEFGRNLQIEKKTDTIPAPVDGLQRAVDELMTDRVDASFHLTGGKDVFSAEMSSMSKHVVSTLEPDFPEEQVAIKAAFKHLLSQRMFLHAKSTGKRIDGRALDEVRRIDALTPFLPKRVHGSALFTRGETQTIATATLGDSGMKQKIDKIDGLEKKRFYLQYTFPPSCVGETGRVGAPGRREVGHGNLAERALIPSLPTEEEFPYSIRVESLITESNGSSSMASVCGGCLALMDAGVPVKTPVAGIAMGMLLGDKNDVATDDNSIVVSDILGSEDALGTMDFKVAGDREGITTFQMDIKCEGLTLSTLQRALEQAKRGRLHILDEMDKALSGPRSLLPPSVPKIATFTIPAERIGKVIGPGGKQIRAVIEDFELANMDVQDTGTIQMSSSDAEKLAKAQAFVEGLVKDGGGGGGGGRGGGGGGRRSPKSPYVGPPPEVGKVYRGKITGIHNFGVFLEILPGPEDKSSPGLEGLCHVSELHVERVRNCEGFVGSLRTDELDVKYLGVNEKGQHQLSRKATMKAGWGGGNRGGGGRRQSNSDRDKKDGGKRETPATMSSEEVDVIAKAIEDIKGL